MEKEAAAGGSPVFNAQHPAPPQPGEFVLWLASGKPSRENARGCMRKSSYGTDSPEKSEPKWHPNLTCWPQKIQTQDPSEKHVTSSVARALVSAQIALLKSSNLQLFIPTVINSNDKLREQEQCLIPSLKWWTSQKHSADEGERSQKPPDSNFQGYSGFL